MVDNPRSSFIPRESSGMVPGKVRRTRTFHVFGFIATTLILASIVTAGGVYFLNKSADSNLIKAQEALSAKKSLINPASIAEIRQFDRQVQAANLLIKNHISPLQIFAALEEYTKQKIQFTSFALEHTPELEVLVELEGETFEFKTLALQESGFGADTLLKNVVFNEVTTSDGEQSDGDDSGERKVLFSLKGILDPTAILYDGNSKRSAEQVSYIENGESLFAREESLLSGGEVLGDEVIMNSL